MKIDCRKCALYPCKTPCLPVEIYANGNVGSKEPLFLDLCTDGEVTKDYNSVLSEVIEDHEIDFDRICFIQPYKIRAIAAMLYVDIPKTEIARLLRISRTTLYRRGSKGP